MKYIRTKYGVYEVVGFDEECIIPNSLIKVKNNYGKERITHCFKNDILKQSVNLAELCDMTVVVEDERPNWIFELEYGIDEELLKKYKETKGVFVYGAIWTEWGLKYVAKMNENGDMVLKDE